MSILSRKSESTLNTQNTPELRPQDKRPVSGHVRLFGGHVSVSGQADASERVICTSSALRAEEALRSYITDTIAHGGAR